MNWDKRTIALLGGLLLFGFLGWTYYSSSNPSTALATATKTSEPADIDFTKPISVEAPNVKYGFAVDNYTVTEGKIEKNQFLSDLLLPHNISYQTIDKVVAKAKDVFDVRKLRVGKEYMILAPKDGEAAHYFIYEPSPFEYVVYDLQGDANVEIIKRKVDTKVVENSGIVESSLWNAIVGNDMSYEIASKMEDAFAWSVDFHHVQKNDRFKLIYEELFIEGESVGVGQIKAATFKHYDKEFNAYFYEDENYAGYFDDQGRPMKKAFLKSPVKFARISSPFNRRRFHPILRRVKPHLGTDYAAPRGTPILAVANGTVTKASYSRGNGRYVKIKHDKVYDTQYLHMSKFAKGIKPGTRVKQGEVIGYVGSTGLATGPHVCFRFWKNGKQVNHRKENLPPPEPMSEASMKDFVVVRDAVKAQLDEIKFVSLAKKDGKSKVDP